VTEISNETRFLHAVEMGLGAWQWGDRMVWGYGQTHKEDDIRSAFQISLDTAEVYGSGRSERLLGQFLKETEQPVLVATKFFPAPWRFMKNSIPNALKGSLNRIGVETVDLYQIHWPSFTMNTDTLMAGLAECVQKGWTRTVGVSNYGQTRMVAAYSALARENIPLASNQMHYSLLNREVEKDGTLARCQELGIRLIAYSPLEKGVLTGKYSPEKLPPGVRAGQYADLLKKIGPLTKLMTAMGQDHDGKTVAQVALNWCICKGTLPIPGAKNAAQAQQNAGALGWKLTDDEIVKLDELTDSIRK
jgi:aryl-alcohol dehydrogenase-like predicted oxidoreductase